MLRSKHVLSLVLLISVPAVAMEQKGQLVAAAEQSAAPASLLDTIVLRENHATKVTTLATLHQQKTVLADAENATNQELSALAAQLVEKLAGKKKQIEGSTAAITSYNTQIEALKAKAAQDEATLKTKAAQDEADLKAKITKEEESKKTLAAEAAKLEEQINPAPKVEGPAEAPKAVKAWSFKFW